MTNLQAALLCVVIICGSGVALLRRGQDGDHVDTVVNEFRRAGYPRGAKVLRVFGEAAWWLNVASVVIAFGALAALAVRSTL